MGIGGLVGQVSAKGATITNSSAAIDVAGTAAPGQAPVGGLVGTFSAGTIQTSYATGAVSNTANATGGFVGNFAGGSLKDVYATGDVSSTSATGVTGGLIGSSGAGSVENAYAVGAVTGSNSVGSFVGSGTGTFAVTSSYALVNGAQLGNGAGTPTVTIPVLSDAALKTQATFTGWDFTTVWTLTEGVSYPVFGQGSSSAIHAPKLGASALKVSVKEGVLTVSEIAAGEQVTVYNVLGATIYRGTESTIALPTRGIYIVVAAGAKAKVVY
jgi:hypothetical protein